MLNVCQLQVLLSIASLASGVIIDSDYNVESEDDVSFFCRFLQTLIYIWIMFNVVVWSRANRHTLRLTGSLTLEKKESLCIRLVG